MNATSTKKSNISTKPVAVKKPALTPSTTPAAKAPTPAAPAPAPARNPEKVLSRVIDMSGEKAVQWLTKTRRTINNHFDSASKKRKCTEAYMNGLIARYGALSDRARAEKAWEPYCQSIGLPTDHTGKDFIS